jgi:hypothetical protein
MVSNQRASIFGSEDVIPEVLTANAPVFGDIFPGCLPTRLSNEDVFVGFLEDRAFWPEPFLFRMRWVPDFD